MKLTTEQIKQVTVGALSMHEAADGIHFQKCTQKQIDAWSTLSHTLGERAQATTGVRLDFHTNAKTLTFSVGGKGKYELWINGLLREQFIAEAAGDTFSAPLCDPLGGGTDEVRVTLCMPSHSVGILQSLSIEGGTLLRPHTHDRKILFLGDSITQGWDAKFDSLSYAYRVSFFFNADSVIQGIGGAYFHETTPDALPYDPDLVLVAYGTNDFGHYRSLDEFRAHVAAFLDLLTALYRNKRIAIISPIWREHREGKAMGSFADCRATLIDEIEHRGLTHIDGLTLVPPMPTLFADGYLHPNDLGFSLYAQNLIRAIVEAEEK